DQPLGVPPWQAAAHVLPDLMRELTLASPGLLGHLLEPIFVPAAVWLDESNQYQVAKSVKLTRVTGVVLPECSPCPQSFALPRRGNSHDIVDHDFGNASRRTRRRPNAFGQQLENSYSSGRATFFEGLRQPRCAVRLQRQRQRREITGQTHGVVAMLAVYAERGQSSLRRLRIRKLIERFPRGLKQGLDRLQIN